MTNIVFFYWIILLFGYMFLNKGFAYIGFAPFYLSEIGLILAAIACVGTFRMGRGYWWRFKQPVMIALIYFLVWQVLSTLPYLAEYKLSAIRDAMLWGYGLYGLFILFVFTRSMISRFLEIYSTIALFYIVWMLVLFYFRLKGVEVFIPILEIPLTEIKSGDVGVHLAGIGAFLLLRFDRRFEKHSLFGHSLIWICWWLAWLFYGAVSRGAMFSSLMSFLVILLIRPRRNWVPALVAGLMLFAFFYVNNISIPLVQKNKGVTISITQIEENIKSTFFSIYKILNEPPSTEIVLPSINDQFIFRSGTIKWRVDWWKDILEYTVKGDYFWMGRGYGINLAVVSDIGRKDDSLRSPHNATMTILARSGVPGMVLWFVFLGSLAIGLLKIIFTKHVSQEARDVAAWMLAYGAAFFVNSSLDVFLEGPMGGIWFWSLVGLALVHIAETPTKLQVLPDKN